MANRSRDIYDVLQTLQYASTPYIAAEEETQDSFQAPDIQNITLTDAVSFPNVGHSGVYYLDDPTTLLGKIQLG